MIVIDGFGRLWTEMFAS